MARNKTSKKSGEKRNVNARPRAYKSSELRSLPQKLEACLGFKPRKFQIQAIEAQLMGRDMVVHAGTGSGKTLTVAGPHLYEANRGVTLFVSPLIALQNEQVNTFREEFGLNAVAINSSHGGCTVENLRKIVEEEYSIIILSPEMLLSKRFIEQVLRRTEFTRRVVSIAVDEAHVISHWGSDFRKKYSELGMARVFLPKGTPMLALSATLPARVHRDVIKTLQISKEDYLWIDEGNDRPNVSLVVRPIHNALNTFADLDFVVPENVSEAKDIPKTFIYYDNVMSGIDMEDHINNLLPEHLQHDRVVRLYNAAFSSDYRDGVMRQFREGRVRILICTDAAGMGCNIPDIEVVVQWKLPGTVSSFVQRAGRAARAIDSGLAVLLVEKQAYSTVVKDLNQTSTATSHAKAQKPAMLSPKERAETQKKAKKYAEEHGVLRGARDGKGDCVYTRTEATVNPDCADEGLYVLVQTGFCRRRVLEKIFDNKPSTPTVECCDLCSPTLLNRVRPGIPKTSKRKPTVKKNDTPCLEVEQELRSWRARIYKRDRSFALFGSSGILDDESVSLLSSAGPIPSKSRLQLVLNGWLWWDLYGDELFHFVSSLDIPPVETKKKRKPEGTAVENPATKKPRVDIVVNGEEVNYASLPHRENSHQVSPTVFGHASSSQQTRLPVRPATPSLPAPMTVPATPQVSQYHPLPHPPYPPSMTPGYHPSNLQYFHGYPSGYYTLPAATPVQYGSHRYPALQSSTMAFRPGATQQSQYPFS